MQPTNHQDDQPQGVPIEPYRGPLTARIQGDSYAGKLLDSRAADTNISELAELRRLWQRLFRNNDALWLIKRGARWLFALVAIAAGLWVNIIADPSYHSPEFFRPMLFFFSFYISCVLVIPACINFIRGAIHSRNSLRPTLYLILSILGVAASYSVLLVIWRAVYYWFSD
jgi:hypothetical protein